MVRRFAPVRLTTIADRFSSRLRDERVAAWLGIWLGISFCLAFLTGLVSHFMQQSAGWAGWPTRPVNLYRVTQGLHVIGGLATVPLLLAKLWTVYPKLFRWPPVRSARHAVERGLILVLVGGALFQLGTGTLNIAYWYPFPFAFTAAHYWTSYLVMGALLIHLSNEWSKVRRAVIEPVTGSPPPSRGSIRPGAGARSAPRYAGLSRRGFFATVAAACGVVTVTTVGETVSPLARLAVLAPRRPGVGPQGLPVNRTAAEAGVTTVARDPAWRLTISGQVRTEQSLSLADLRAMPHRVARLPIACVEGWSAEGTWSGVPLRDLLIAAGARADAIVGVESLEQRGAYRASVLASPLWHDPLTLLALELNGEPLTADHGFPCRLVAPNRPGVLQTKWVGRLVVSEP